MAETIGISINGVEVRVETGTTVAAAIVIAGHSTFHRSVTGEPRGPLCGMGICFECCVNIDGRPHCPSCQTICTAGMEILTV